MNLQVTSYLQDEKSMEDSPDKREYSKAINLGNESDEDIVFRKRDKGLFDSTALSVRGKTKGKADEMKRFNTQFN